MEANTQTLPKVAYLFGAGATHAELFYLKKDESLDATYYEKRGLLISHVSKRVINAALKQKGFSTGIENITSNGSLNIELLISLFEANRIQDSKVATLKSLVAQDIQTHLSKTLKKKFVLHKALLELHGKTTHREELIGLISLNYDDVLDEAYQANLGTKPNYCFTSSLQTGVPLLKLHGSFNWDKVELYGKRKKIGIMPLGVNKNYLSPPYNFIWGRAYEILSECNILRVIGCSLNQADMGLVDLLFKAHKARDSKFEIQLIDFETPCKNIKNTLGFFPDIVEAKDIEGALIGDRQILIENGSGNPFSIWLAAKADKMLRGDFANTTFIKKLF